MAGISPALVLQEWACLKTGSKLLVELPWTSPGHLTQGMVLAKVQLLWEFKQQVCKPLPGRLTLAASALHSSPQPGAERSSRMGHTLPSMSHWEIRPCSTRASSTSWLDFLTWRGIVEGETGDGEMLSQDEDSSPPVALHLPLGVLFAPLPERAPVSWWNHSSRMNMFWVWFLTVMCLSQGEIGGQSHVWNASYSQHTLSTNSRWHRTSHSVGLVEWTHICPTGIGIRMNASTYSCSYANLDHHIQDLSGFWKPHHGGEHRQKKDTSRPWPLCREPTKGCKGTKRS